jgi:peptidoglycan-associated lipoprotein
MSTRYHLSAFNFCLCLLAVAMLFGCASRKVVTAAQDQSFVPGQEPQAQAPAVEEAQVSPPPSQPEPAKEEPPMEAAKVEPAEPARAEEPAIEAPPAQAPAVEETRIAEQPVAPAPAPTPEPAPAVEPEPPVAELSDAFFDFDRFVIRSDARESLEANAAILKAQSDKKVLIEGHCDERGTSAYNLVLGERRAQAAKQYLQDLGIPASQIQIMSYGKERPFCTEHSEDCWQSNRRAHFTRR